MVNIYTDGACLGNPGPGGWCFALEDSDKPKGPPAFKRVGGERMTTNNQMELTAIREALKYHRGDVCILTDSQGCINWLTGAWKRQQLEIIRLCDEIEEIIEQNEINLTFEKIKGHSGIYLNELVDVAAHNEAQRQKTLLTAFK
jgi:ribonuclease HI